MQKFNAHFEAWRWTGQFCLLTTGLAGSPLGMVNQPPLVVASNLFTPLEEASRVQPGSVHPHPEVAPTPPVLPRGMLPGLGVSPAPGCIASSSPQPRCGGAPDGCVFAMLSSPSSGVDGAGADTASPSEPPQLGAPARVSPYSVIDITPFQEDPPLPPTPDPGAEEEGATPHVPSGYLVPVPCGYAVPSNLPLLLPAYSSPVVTHIPTEPAGRAQAGLGALAPHLVARLCPQATSGPQVTSVTGARSRKGSELVVCGDFEASSDWSVLSLSHQPPHLPPPSRAPAPCAFG